MDSAGLKREDMAARCCRAPRVVPYGFAASSAEVPGALLPLWSPLGETAASSTCAQQGKGLRGEVQARRASEAWAVQGGGKVRDPCVRRAGWLGRAQGGLGRALGAPHVDLVRLAFASRTKRMKVTSTPEVPGPSRSWSPGNVARP